MFTRKLDVLVKRGIYETIHKDVFPYEIPILEELYGVGNITEVVPGKDYPIVEVDADMEFGRLQALYERHLTVNVTNAEYIFGREGGESIAKQFDLGDGSMPAPREDGEEEDAEIRIERYEEMTKDRLHVLCDDQDIEWRPNDNKAHLIALLRGDHGTTDATEPGRSTAGVEG